MHNAEDTLDKIERDVEEAVEKIDKASKKKINVFYNWFVKIFSIVVLLASVYTAVLGMAGSAAVLATLFLLTWTIFIIGQFGIAVAKGMMESQKYTAEKKYRRLTPIK